MVTHNNEIYGKPKDAENAKQMLKKFSGQTQFVYSGVCIYQGELEKCVVFSEATEVNFDELSDDVIEGYVNTGEPMDKAGSYGIQGIGGTLVKSIKGDYFNVVGFPLHRFCKEMQKILQK